MIFYSTINKPAQRRAGKKTLLDASGVQVGQAIEWAHGGNASEITDAERRALLECCGWKEVRYWKALAVKSLMATKSCAEIVRHFRARKGMKESTVKNIHRALSKAAGE
jgi:hypothetical protein